LLIQIISNDFVIVLDLAINRKVVEILKTKALVPTFDPSMKTLMRIVKFMTENSSGGKTQLALDTKLNYARLAKHLVWMEKKGLVESTIDDNKINVSLTKTGRDFAKVISKII
jgi:predicted transcriptional regulator